MNNKIKISLLVVAIIAISVLLTLFGRYCYDLGWAGGYEEKRIVTIETSPEYIKLRDALKVYADHGKWTGIFAKLWGGGGYGYSVAESALGIEEEQDPLSWFSTHKDHCEKCKSGSKCEELDVKIQHNNIIKQGQKYGSSN